MAKQVSEILVKLGIQGFEGLDKLKSSFRGLEKAIGPTDAAIQTARQSIVDFAGSGKQSIQSIQGQIDAFKGLQTQATIGGNVYRQLAGDVNRLSDTLKGLKNEYEEVGRAAKRTDAQIAAEFPARKPEAFRKQLAALNRQLDQLSVSARAYGDALTEITIREVAFGRAQARQQVIAGAQAVGAPLISNMQPKQQLPNTLAALQLRISELSQDFQNLDRAGGPYQETLAEINRLQRELSNATEDGNADRKDEIRQRIENYRAITAENAALREQRQQRRSIERGRARTAGDRIIERPMREISGLYQQIGQIGMQPIVGDIEMMGNSYTRVSNDIKRATAASNGSIQSLNAQRSAWQMLRVQLDPASAGFAKASQQIEQLDRRLGKLQQTQGRRMGGMQMAQAAGAAISGGIFGGPEGFLGGAIGGITGGVGGAFVGAAAGAQIGMLRQQLGGFADYAAQIQKMKIALDGAAGSQGEFSRAVAAATSATQNLNVPQDIAIQGMTRLTAAVKGAGGQVADAELVFKSVTSAIKATGGSAQDVDGAITAMVQVFSKGKVSAEELSGQLGERLPGAVTKFAEANKMSLPELQKALEQGQVGLNELMNFIVQLGDEYSGVAEKIAGSSQDAGARLTVAYNNMRIAIGEALQPIGAQFQEAFIPFIEQITPALVAVLPEIGKFMVALAKNFDTAAIALGAFMATLAIAKITSFTFSLGALITGLGSVATAAGGAATAMTGLAAASAAVPWVALAAGAAAAGAAIYNAATAQQEFNRKIYEAPLVDVQAEIQQLSKDLFDAEQKLLNTGMQFGTLSREAAFAQAKVDGLRAALHQAEGDYKVRLLYEQVGVTPSDKHLGPGFAAPKLQPKPNEFPRLAEDKANKAKSAADKAAREAQRAFDEQLQKMLQEEDFTLKKFALQEKIRLEQEKQGAIQAGRLDSEMQLAEIANQRLDLDIRATALASENEKLENLRKQGLAEGLDVQKIAQKMQQNITEDLGIQYENQKLNTQEIKVQRDLEKERENLNRALNQELQDRRYELGLITKEEYNRLQIERERRRLEAQYQGLPGAQGRIDEGVDLFRREIDPTFAEGLQSQLAIVRRELDDLTKPINQVVGAANAIGDAFTQSFASVINGSATTQEALASFFQNLANYFLDMAAQIIQKMIVMAILNQVTGLLPGAKGTGSFAGKGYFDPITGLGAAGPNFGLAMGGVVSKNGIEPFAMGGIVNKPTLFKYADGGAGRFGLMGEAGPEAIMPLKRGRDGKLGVAGGGGVNVGTINISVENTGENLTPAAQKQIAGQVRGIVLATLANEKRSGGMLR